MGEASSDVTALVAYDCAQGEQAYVVDEATGAPGCVTAG
jgi:hypothetical protein